MKFVIYEVIEKSYVKGHFIKRNGQKYWVKPYENHRTKAVNPETTNLRTFKKLSNTTFNSDKSNEPSDYNKHSNSYVNTNSDNSSDDNFVLKFALDTAQDIQKMDDGEKKNFDNVLNNCKSIVKKLGYLDDNVLHLFKPSNAEAEPISPKKVKKVRGINKEAKKIYLRVNNSDIKQHVASIVKNTKI